jgi:hypothetical protein
MRSTFITFTARSSRVALRIVMTGERSVGGRESGLLVSGEIDGTIASLSQFIPPVDIVELGAGGAAIVFANQIEVKWAGVADLSS